MKNKLKNMNKKPLIFVLILLVLGIIGSTIAYYVSNNSFVNEFKAMTYKIVLEEEFHNEFGTKKVYIRNVDSTNTPVVLRVNYNESWTKDNQVLSNKINGVDAVNKNWTSTFTNDFVLNNDGWYYYKKMLDPNESIQLLESISKNTTAINSATNKDDYTSFNYELAFNYEAIEAKVEAVSSIWNKNITINGDNVVWE